jgi:hypothetical protein
MSTITASHSAIAVNGFAGEAPKSFFRKVYERVVESQQARAEKGVAAYLASHGGLLTDDMEREIMARFSANSVLRRSR